MEGLETLKNELQAKIDKAVEGSKVDKATIDAIETKLANAVKTEQLEEVNKSLLEVAGKIEALKVTNKPTSKKAEFVKQFFDAVKSFDEKQAQNHVLKADNAFNLFAIAGTPFANDEANLDAGILTSTSRFLGVEQNQYSDTALLNALASFAQPIEPGEALKVVVPHDENGIPLTVAELKTKPRATVKWKEEKVEATKIAVEWVVSREYQKRTEVMGAFMSEYFNSLMTQELQTTFFTSVTTAGSSFTAPTGLSIANATDYDALLALASTIVNAKYRPTHVVINTIDMANMFGAKGLDEHYQLQNGQSISLINGGAQMVIGGKVISVIEVDSDILAAGTVSMFDVTKLKLGLGTSVEYNINPYEFFSQNAVVNQLEIAFAVLLPSNHVNAVITDTYENIISAIEGGE